MFRPRIGATLQLLLLSTVLAAGSVHGIEYRRVTNCCPSTDPRWTLISPALSPDGQAVAYCDESVWDAARKPRSFLQLLVLDGQPRPFVLPPAPDGSVRSPSWSPDGQRLAVVVDHADAQRCGIWVCDRQDGAVLEFPVQWVDDPSAEEPSWSPDGAALAYTSHGEMFTVSGPDAVPVRVPISGSVESPSWATGALVYVHDAHIWRQHDGNVRALTWGPWQDAAPAISADGEWVAFASDRSGNWDIWVVSAGGGTAVRITDDAADDRDPTWSAAGDRLAFVSWRDGSPNVWLASDLPLYTTRAVTTSWSGLKQAFR